MKETTGVSNPHNDTDIEPVSCNVKPGGVAPSGLSTRSVNDRILIHRGRRIVLHAWTGTRIVSVNIDSYFVSDGAIEKAMGTMMDEMDRSYGPKSTATILAVWHDPAAELVRFRIRVPHDKYIVWKRASMQSITPTRAEQTIDDRLEIFEIFGQKELTLEDKRPKSTIKDAPATTGGRLVVRQPKRLILLIIISWMALFFVQLAIGSAILSFTTLCLLTIPFVIAGITAKRFPAWRTKLIERLNRQSKTVTDTPEQIALPAHQTDETWSKLREAVAENAPDRAKDVALAEMRIRTLLESPTPSLNQTVIDAYARIETSRDHLAKSYAAALPMADAQQRASLTDQLATSLAALGAEAEDARLIVFADASFDFQTTARYIQARNDPSLRLGSDG